MEVLLKIATGHNGYRDDPLYGVVTAQKEAPLADQRGKA